MVCNVQEDKTKKERKLTDLSELARTFPESERKFTLTMNIPDKEQQWIRKAIA